MQRFISTGLAALVVILMTCGMVINRSTVLAEPRDKLIPSDKTLLADESGSQQSQAEIHAASRDYLAALQQGDGKAIATFWTAHGIYVDSSGQSHPARSLITQEFSHPSTKQRFAEDAERNRELPKPGSIHWVTTNVALERGTTRQREAETGELLDVNFLAVWVKQDKQWLLDYVQETTGISETPVQKSSSPGNLGALEWMVGQWASQGTGPVARLTVHWSENKKYLIQKFRVNLADQKQLQGEQRIAWDPDRKTIRSWIFRADGGFAESSWNREGDTWIVKTQGVNASGAKTSSVNLWTPEGPDRCWCKSIRLPAGEDSEDPSEEDEVILHLQRI